MNDRMQWPHGIVEPGGFNFTAHYSNGSLYRGHRDLTAAETRKRAERFLNAWSTGPVTIIAVIGRPKD